MHMRVTWLGLSIDVVGDGEQFVVWTGSARPHEASSQACELLIKGLAPQMQAAHSQI